MKGKRFTEEQIIGVLNEAEQVGNIREVCRLHNITEQTFYRWRTKFGGVGSMLVAFVSCVGTWVSALCS